MNVPLSRDAKGSELIVLLDVNDISIERGEEIPDTPILTPVVFGLLRPVDGLEGALAWKTFSSPLSEVFEDAACIGVELSKASKSLPKADPLLFEESKSWG